MRRLFEMGEDRSLGDRGFRSWLSGSWLRLGQSTLDDALPVEQRDHVRIDRAQRAIGAQLGKLFRRQFSELVLVNRPVVSNLLLLADRVALLVAWLESDSLLLEQVHAANNVHKIIGRTALAFEFLTELNGVLREGAWLTILEQWDFRLIGDHRRITINTKQETLAIFVIGEHERIAAHKGRHIVILVSVAIITHEQVFALAHTHCGDRGVLVADKDDRISGCGHAEFGHGDRYGVRGAQEAERLVDLLYTQARMLLWVEGLRVLVEQNVSGQLWMLCIRCVFHGSLRLIRLAGCNGNDQGRQQSEWQGMQQLQMFHTSLHKSRLSGAMKRVRTTAISLLASAVLIAPSACSQSDDGSRSTRRAITQSQAIAADFLGTELALSPETASRLDMEAYLGPSAIYTLDNHSQAGFERRRLVRIELLQRLRQRPRLPADHALTRDLAVAETAIVDLISLEQLGYGRFDYADQRPYALDPYSGIWIEGPNLLAYRQTINTVDQAAAFMARLRSLSAAVEDTRRRLIADRAAGLEMPRALAEETSRRLDLLTADAPSALDLLTATFAALTLDVSDLEPDQREQLVSVVQNEVRDRLRPALRDLSDTVAEMAEDASDQAGIWAQPKGQDLFVGILKASIGEQLNSERLHVRHVEDVAAQSQALRELLVLPTAEDAPAPTEPPIRPERLQDQLAWFESLVSEPEPVAPPTDVPVREADIVERLAPRTVWALIQEAPSFQAQIDAASSYQSLWVTQPYLTWRTEGDGELPAYRTLTAYPAIDDAWRLYVWQNSFEPSSSAPLDQAAYASIRLIQSTLAAADTGIHLDRWTLSEATSYIAEQSGLSEPFSRQLALRIMARPGYHTAVAAAYYRFETLAERAQAVLGERYSETDFQRTLIQPGPRPLPFIETDVEAWYGARLAN